MVMKMAVKVAGYVKLAKLWERKRDAALKLHNDHYREKYSTSGEYELASVFVDITGNKSITGRSAMLELLKLCMESKVDLIDTPTKAYLAANMEELCFLLHFLFSLNHRVDIITDDSEYGINTVENEDQVREALADMAANYVSIETDKYQKWKSKVMEAVQKE